MAIFDEPSRQPLPQPTFEDVTHAAHKGLVNMIPLIGGAGAELIGLLSSPVSGRRDDWFADLERRLRELEGKVEDFHFDDLEKNEQFISATLQATQAALRTHQAEKLEALRNAVLNVAIGNSPLEDLQLIFLNLVDSFTPTHLQVLRHFQGRDRSNAAKFGALRDITDQVVMDLRDRGLLADTRVRSQIGIGIGNQRLPRGRCSSSGGDFSPTLRAIDSVCGPVCRGEIAAEFHWRKCMTSSRDLCCGFRDPFVS